MPRHAAIMKKDLAIFEGHGIRRLYDEKTETWWFSAVDIMQVLTQQSYYFAFDITLTIQSKPVRDWIWAGEDSS